MADLQFAACVILGNDDECKAKLWDIRGCNLPLELWHIDCNREYMSEKPYSDFESRQGFLFLSRGETGEKSAWIDTRTENKGKAAPTQLLAFSSINSRDNMDVWQARERPAQRAPGSLEWIKELMRATHF
jgi:hypothetical protein